MIILAGMVITLLIVGLILMWFVADRIEKNQTYVYKGNRYLYKGKCLIKDPTSKMWVDGIMYMSFKSGQLFVREENDFIVKFETYKQWKNGRNDKSSRGNKHCNIS